MIIPPNKYTLATIIGRKEHQKKFKRVLNSTEASFLVVYGRRRVGKTFIVREYFKKHLVFDFSGAYNENLKTQLGHFFSEYLLRTEAKKETSAPSSWSEAFRYLANYTLSLSDKKRHVLFIDELPWLDTHKSGFVSALEYFWNQYISKQSNIILVVCGSANAWIQKKLFKSKGGLYNRVTHKAKLEPFTLNETELFLKSKNVKLSRYQIIEIYMAMGGIPHYLKEIEPGISSIQAIDQICFAKTGLLYDEFEQLYPSIFDNAENHLKIINTLSKKPQGLSRSNLVKLSKLPDGGIVTRTLTELEESGFINIILPFQKKKKEAIYKLADLYSLFYFKFIKNNQCTGKGTWEKLSRSSAYKAWSGYAFENICYSHIEQIKKQLSIQGMHCKVSSWTSKGTKSLPGSQIDLLIDRDDSVINLCEAKFTKEPFLINKTYHRKMIERAMIFKSISKTKNTVFHTLLTTYPAIKNQYYLEQIQSEVNMDALFN